MDRLQELRRRYAQSLPAKAAELTVAWQGFRADPAAGLAELHQIVHRLAGSASAYGFDELGAIAQRADGIFSEWLGLPPSLRASAETLAERLEPRVAELTAALGA